MNNTTVISKWIICISGFLQDEGAPTGMVGLWHKARVHAAPSCAVELRSWCQNWSDLAELVHRSQPSRFLDNAPPPEIFIIGYSWGGFSATLLAGELKERGIKVREMLLCDAVYRHSYKLGHWRAMAGNSKIVIPDNVQEVRWFRQQNKRIRPFFKGRLNPYWWIWPAGHDVVAEDRLKTLIHPPRILNQYEHTYIDDAFEFHNAAVRMLEPAA